MKTFQFKAFLSAFFLLVGVGMYAQSVSGTVSSEDGPLPGATVVVKGTTNGTTTDFDGNFTIAADADAVLVVSFVGFTSQEVAVDGQDQISVSLSAGNELDEIVVTGYGTIVKRDATGAVDAIGSETFDLISSDSPAQLLRGKVAGVQITSASGEPGAGVSIRVRGNTSVRSGNEPLIVVDGVPLSGGNTQSASGEFGGLGGGSPRNPLNFINQNDIESISVLKDASSTAIYGSRGANGVILITTKRAKQGAGEAKVTYSGSFSFSSFAENSSYEDVMSESEFKSNLPADATSVIAETGSYNWRDAILRNAASYQHDVSFVTSGENSATRLSFGANIQDGIVQKTGMDKYNLSFFNSYDFMDKKVNIQTRALYSDIDDQSHLITNDAGYQGNIIGAALYWRPSLSSFQPNGDYTFVQRDYVNPKHLLDAYDDLTNTKRLLASVNVSIKLSDKLTFKSLYAVDNSRSLRESQMAPQILLQDQSQNGFEGTARVSTDERLNKTFENTLNYKDSFGELNLDLLLGYSYYNYYASGKSFFARGFNADQENLIDNLEGVTSGPGNGPSSYANESELQSYFARAVMSYDKFLATLTYRVDGSSKFGEDAKYGSFPSIGLGYKVFENAEGSINDLKIRVNYGKTGNQEFAPNSAISVASYSNTALSLVNNANPDLEWEKTTSYGVGVDFSLLNSKLTGSVDYFVKETEDLIFPIPESATKPGPASPRLINLDGVLENTGVEVSLNYNILNNDNVTWDVSANASFLDNVIKDFPGFIPTANINGQGLSGAFAQVIANDSPIFNYYVFEFLGYDSNGNSQYTQPDGSAGPLGSAAKQLDEEFQPIPKVNLGFSTSVSFDKFDVGTTFYGQFGHYLYSNTANALYVRSAYPTRNVPKYVLDSGQSSADPNTPSTKFMEKGDFLRWSNLTIGYTFDQSVANQIGADNLRLYVNANNLATFTDYTGFDPEVSIDKGRNGVPSAGMDYFTYPRARTFSFGVNLTF